MRRCSARSHAELKIHLCTLATLALLFVAGMAARCEGHSLQQLQPLLQPLHLRMATRSVDLCYSKLESKMALAKMATEAAGMF